MNATNRIDNLTRTAGVEPATSEIPARNVSTPQHAGLIQDLTQLSSAGRQIAQSVSEPDVRLDKVASIQGALQNGTYQVSASDVAQKVLDSMIDSSK